jgi:hypothetical protein
VAIQPVGRPVYETRYEPAAPVGLTSDERRTWLMNHASWGAIVAGVVAALLVQMLLSLLGLGVGLAGFQVIGDVTGEMGATATVAGLSMQAAIWWVASGLVGAFAGGIVAGRLCGSARHSTAAWHGFVAWCAMTLLVVAMLGNTLGPVLRQAFSSASPQTAKLLGDDVVEYDRTAQSKLAAQVGNLLNPNDPSATYQAIISYVKANESGDKATADAAHQQAVNGLSRIANISPDDAQNRLNQLQQNYQQTLRQAAQTAVAARKDAARGALFAFAALLLSGIASIVGGGLGTPRRVGSGLV